MSIPGELERARRLTFADDEVAAKELLLALLPRIEAQQRDDWALEDLAQLGELYLTRTAYDGVRESVRRLRECLAVYRSVLDGSATDDVVSQVTMSTRDVEHLVTRYSRRAQFLETGLAAAIGDHTAAAHLLAGLDGSTSEFDDLVTEFAHLRLRARVECARALCDDDLHVRSEPLWQQAIEDLGEFPGDAEEADRLWVLVALGYARFCIETGRRAEAEPWLRRAGARATSREWPLVTARTQLERAAASWQAGDHVTTERLVNECYPVIAQYARADDVSRCWLYFGLTRLAAGGLQAADDCWEHAERHWRELGKPLFIHRILLQRSWIAIFRGRYPDAVAMVGQARELLDSTPRSSWLAYARLDDHLGTIWRADALADLGFDGAGDPDEEWTDAEARYEASLGVIDGEAGTPAYETAMTKLGKAAELKIPAALAVDSVRYAITDAEARAQWGRCISAPLLASAFAVAWESEDDELVASLIEYHSARGTFAADLPSTDGLEFSRVATAAAPVSDLDELALVAGGEPGDEAGPSLTRLGPLPPLRMDPTAEPLLTRYRDLALQRYGQHVTAPEPAWSTWP